MKLSALRHTLSILLLPVMVVIVLPAWLRSSLSETDTRWSAGLLAWPGRLGGWLIAAAGFALFTWCVRLFATQGQGTLAPWDPTRRLVASGPYQHTRNPMISAVALMLVGQALALGSWISGAWAGFFILVNHVYFILLEEPGLEQRFGDAYRRYKAHVPRWVPRRRPWTGEE